MNLLVFILQSNRLHGGLGPRLELEEEIHHSKENTRGSVGSMEEKLEVQDAKIKKPRRRWRRRSTALVTALGMAEHRRGVAVHRPMNSTPNDRVSMAND